MRPVALGLAAFALLVAPPDKGGLPLRKVDLSEPNQNALIAFDGRTEILYISSVLRPAAPTKVLEMLPLPSEPTAELADAGVIERAARVYNRFVEREIAKRDRRRRMEDLACFAETGALLACLIGCVLALLRGRRRVALGFGIAAVMLILLLIAMPGAIRAKMAGGERSLAVDVLSQQQLGPHGQTVVKAERADDLVTWIEEFIRREGGDLTVFDDGFRALVRSYVEGGYPYFVFDVIEAAPDSGPVAPVRYTFACDHLYFPLRISSRATGETAVNLIVVESHGNLVPNRGPWTWTRRTAFPLAAGELGEIDPKLQELFGAATPTIRTVHFRSAPEELDEDFVARPRGQ